MKIHSQIPSLKDSMAEKLQQNKGLEGQPATSDSMSYPDMEGNNSKVDFFSLLPLLIPLLQQLLERLESSHNSPPDVMPEAATPGLFSLNILISLVIDQKSAREVFLSHCL